MPRNILQEKIFPRIIIFGYKFLQEVIIQGTNFSINKYLHIQTSPGSN